MIIAQAIRFGVALLPYIAAVVLVVVVVFLLIQFLPSLARLAGRGVTAVEDSVKEANEAYADERKRDS